MLLSPHRRSVLTNACIKPSADPGTRIPGTIYEPKGEVRLLGLLSETCPSQQEDYLDAGDGLLICMKRPKRRGPRSARKSCWEPQKPGPNVSDASDVEPDPCPASRQQEILEEPASSTPAASNNPSSPEVSPESTSQLHSGSFPFHWMWESFSLKGQAVFRNRALEKAKKRRSPRPSGTAVSELHATPEPSLGSTGGQAATSPKGSQCSNSDTSSRHQKHQQHAGPAAGSTLFPLYWKMEARSEARKRQLRQERRRWLQLTHQLLNLENQSPEHEKRLSAKQLEDKLRAEFLCLATEPSEPKPPREKSRPKSHIRSTKEEPTFQPAINRKVPNFKNLQKRFQEQLEQRKDQAKLTICQPFRLRSTSSSQELFNSEEKGTQEDPFYHLWGLQWRAQSCPDFIPPGIRPVMHTKTTDKRQEANRLLLLAWERREQKEKRRAELRRAKEQQVQKEVAKCLAAYRPPVNSVVSTERRLEVLRRQEKLRTDEYMLQLQEMQNRVESRPYLFERVMQANARQAVERRFSQVLSALGIDEEMLWKHAIQKANGKSSVKAIRKRTESSEDFTEST